MQKGTINSPWLESEKNEGSELEHRKRRLGPSGSAGAAPATPLRRRWAAPAGLLGAVVATGLGLSFWKSHAVEQANAAAAIMAEPAEVVTIATAEPRSYRRSNTSIGTVVALRSIALRNEVAGTVAETRLTPGAVVEAGAVLVALDTSVEAAELKALQAQAALARTLAQRMERAVQGRATSQIELDRAKAEVEVADAQIARTEAVIARKTIRAPFPARVGLSDVHLGQYLNEGTLITTLQGIDDAIQVDFAVPQQVGQTLKAGDAVEIAPGYGSERIVARIVALDARIDVSTRNVWVRALVDDSANVPLPGASVRVEVPNGERIAAVGIPVNAARKGPAGDHVFVIASDENGDPRAQLRKVQLGPVLNDEILVLSGLEAGERVAAVGSFKLREEALVAIVDRPAERATH